MGSPRNIELEKGLDILEKASDEDLKLNFEDAMRFYVQGVMYLLHAAKYNTDSQQEKQRLKEKCLECISRIKLMKDYRNQMYGKGVIDELETLSDDHVLTMVTEVICMSGDFMELKRPKHHYTYFISIAINVIFFITLFKGFIY